jgi:hypothetical protein
MSSRALLVPRLMIYAYVCFWLVKPFFRITHNPPPPIRGEFTFVLERLTLFTHIWAFYMLVCYVLEVSFASTWLVAKIADPGAIAMPDVKPRANHDEPVVVTEYRVRLRLAEQITRTIERLVWFPVIAVSLMILARASAIDAWGWSPVLVGNFVGYFVLIVACVLNVHAVANAAKHRALAVIREERRRATPETPTAKSIDRTVEELESLRGGAFSPLWEHPLVRSAALPLLTLASTLFIDLGMLRRMLGF